VLVYFQLLKEDAAAVNCMVLCNWLLIAHKQWSKQSREGDGIILVATRNKKTICSTRRKH